MKPFKRKNSKNTILWATVCLLLLLGLGIQFPHEPIESKPIEHKMDAPAEVAAIFERACFDCHSDHTQLKWYDQIAPISWKVKKDITRAREVMNLSGWNDLSKDDQEGLLWGMLNMMKQGKMPLKNYAAVHPNAKISSADIATIEKYVRSLGNDQIVSDTTRKQNAHQAFEDWKQEHATQVSVPLSPNGIPYSDEFKSWKVIGLSTLFDNSMRVIYGNDIAAKAIEEENFHPWPDGAKIVKAVWEQVANKYGEVRPGKFINVQIMEKDAKRFKDTEGWGFAKFSTQALIPTGESASFASKSCISCHRQLAEETGFVFSVPLKVNQH